MNDCESESAEMGGPLVKSVSSYDSSRTRRIQDCIPGTDEFPLARLQGQVVWSITSVADVSGLVAIIQRRSIRPRDQTMTAGNRKALRAEKAVRTYFFNP